MQRQVNIHVLSARLLRFSEISKKEDTERKPERTHEAPGEL